MLKKYLINPVAKPRMTRCDVWKKRPVVLKYREFCDLCRAHKVKIPVSGATVYFIIPMPQSWSKKKKEQMNDTPHQQTPDVDNLLKAVLDAIYDQDGVVWDIHIKKRWGYEGAICISEF